MKMHDNSSPKIVINNSYMIMHEDIGHGAHGPSLKSISKENQ